MLLAAATRRRASASRASGRWTRAHLQRHDGLLAWRWADGSVVDREPAADADLDAARALLVAGEPLRARRSYRARRAAASAARSRARDLERAGELVLVAGPWARADRRREPELLLPARVRARSAARRRPPLGRARRVLAPAADRADRARRPAARLGAGRRRRASRRPARRQRRRAPAYGYDAVRVPLRLAESCARADRALAARAWPALRGATRPPAVLASTAPRARRRRAPGRARRRRRAPPHAAGDARRRATRLLDRAGALDAARAELLRRRWVALARVMLTTHRLGAC